MIDRYVVLVNVGGKYRADLEQTANTPYDAQVLFDDRYQVLDGLLLANGGGVGHVTLFDTEKDCDVQFVCLTRYTQKEVE